MRSTALAGLILLCTLIFSNNSTVSADAPITQAFKDTKQIDSGLEVIEASIKKTDNKTVETEPAEQSYVIVSGDTLSSIANNFGTTWRRIYDKNAQISDPNIIHVGEEINIPKSDEILVERSLPQVSQPQVVNSGVNKQESKSVSNTPVVVNPRGSSGGNSYYVGYCTWYAKNKRPDLPNNLGNADTWVARASVQVIPAGSVPRVGAIGQQGMHVVYVERVNPDGTVFISEMNYKGFGVVSTRTVPANTFRYIY